MTRVSLQPTRPTSRLLIWFLPLCAVLLCGLLTPGFVLRAHAQVLTGELDGTVRDATGAVVPNAVVTVTNSDENQIVRTVKTDHLGQFTAPLLAIGTYAVKITAAGFDPFTLGSLQVHVGQPSMVPVTLTVTGGTQSVSVEATNLSIQLDTASAGTLIDSQQLTQLSLSNRNYLQLLSIQPGVSGPVPGEDPRGNIKSSGAVNTQTYSVNGNATSTNGYYLDGADTLKRAGQQPVTFPSVDFTSEINLIRGSYGADIGGPGAAVVTVQTKSGTTEFHGGAFGFFRSQIFNANTPLGKGSGLARPVQREADFGYYLGGPVWIPGVTKRDTSKTFFFFGQEFLRSLDGYVQSLTNIPTQAQRAGTFATPVCPANVACGAAGIKQVTAFNAVSAEYLKDVYSSIPYPNNPADPQGLVSEQDGSNNETQTLIRIDRQFTPKLSGFFRYLDDPFTLLVPYGFQQVSFVPNVATSAITDGSTSWFGHLTYVLGSNHVFEGGYSQRSNWVTTRDVGSMATVNATDVNIVLPYTNTLDHVPNLTVGGSALKGSGPYDERSPEQQIFLNNTNTWGRHTIEAGFNIEFQVSYSNSAGANAGNFVFAATPVPTGSGTSQFAQAFSDFLGGRPTQFTQANVDIDSAAQSNIYEGYVQDNVHLTPRLTLLGGVRYTFFSPYSNAVYQNKPFHPEQNFYAPTFNTAEAPTLDQAGNLCLEPATVCGTSGRLPNPNYNPTDGIIVAGVNSPYGNTTVDSRTNDFAPRLGFTYDLFGNGTASLRGGYGIYYDQIIENTAKFPTNQDPPNVYTATVTNPNFYNPGNGSSNSPQGLQAYQEESKQPYTEQFSLDLQQQLQPDLTLDIGYYGSVGHHQQADEDINQPQPGAYRSLPGGAVTINATNTPLLNLVRPYQGWSFITDNLTIFKSNYNSLQTSLRYHTSKGAQILVNYTFSRALTNARSPQYNGNLAPEYGPDGTTRDDILNAAIVYPFPFWRENHHWYGEVLGGWETSGIITIGSGEFMTISQSGVDPAGLGLLVGPSTARPDQPGNPNSGDFQNRYAYQGSYFNTAAFTAVPAGQYRPGNAPVADIRGPGYQVWNLSLFKNIAIHNRYTLQLRAESFNTFNHPNPSAVNTTMGATAFGQVTAFGDPRRMQFAVKITF